MSTDPVYRAQIVTSEVPTPPPFKNPNAVGADTFAMLGIDTNNYSKKHKWHGLDAARYILLSVGLATVIVNAVYCLFIPNNVEMAMRERLQAEGSIDGKRYAQLKQGALQAAYITQGVAVGIGVAFFVMGLGTKLLPVPFTITSLVLYVVSVLGFGMFDPMQLLSGSVWNIIVIVSLAAAVRTAWVYQRQHEEEQLQTRFGDGM